MSPCKVALEGNNIKNICLGPMWWYTPVIPTMHEAQVVGLQSEAFR
jgi:hypothetical protein